MARTTEEIKLQMTDAFLASPTLRNAYGIAEGTAWSTAFSAVSIENILLFIVAAAIHVVERIFDQFKADVDNKVESLIVASVPWYHAMALKFQYGDALTINPDTYAYGYATEDETKRIVKYCAVRDRGVNIRVLVSKDVDGSPAPLGYSEMTAFTEYMDRVKLAGVVLMCNTYNSDHAMIYAKITVDPLVINTSGTLVGNNSVHPVEDAIKEHLKNILYGGTLNKTKLVDAIQAVEGVEDVELTSLECKADAEADYTTVTGNNYVGVSGSYIADDLRTTLTYQAS